MEGGSGSLPTRIQEWGVAIHYGHWLCLCIQEREGHTWYQQEALPSCTALPQHTWCWCCHLLAAASPLNRPSRRGGRRETGRREEPKVWSSILNDLGLLLKGWQMTSLLTPLPGSLPFLRTDSTILALNNFQILPHTLRENLNDYGN